MELQKSMAKMDANLNHLAETSKHYDSKLDALSEKLHNKIEDVGKEIHAVAQDVHAAKAVAKSMGALIAFMGALITIAIAIVGYIAIPVLFKLLDVGAEILKKTH